ncbi:hypothetical protein AGMMS50239_24640 [Bacteroidia bacterium]|nr:hypothetical protein AGMMS50239_24640 [Bacteroidia bacterium]
MKTNYNSSTILTNLNNNLPVIISAQATQNHHTFLGLVQWYTYDDGHSWIIDGYENRRIKYTYRYEWVYGGQADPTVFTPYITMTEEYISETPEYFIMNWGWDSSHDYGRYAMGSNPVWTANLHDENGNTLTLNFQYQKKMICNFTVN